MIDYVLSFYNQTFFIFGNIDNIIMILGATLGLEIEKFLPKRFQVGLGVIFGASLGNACSDFLGGIGANDFILAINTAMGCLTAMIFIPIFAFIGKLKRLYRKEIK